MALIAAILLFVLGLINGFIFGHPDSYASAFNSIQFLFAYFLEVVTYLTFALMITLVIRRPGIVIVGLMMYTLAFEPFLTLFLGNFPHHNYTDSTILPKIFQNIAPLFPIRALNNLIHVPFQRYVLQEIQDYVSLKEVLIVLGWLILNISTCYWLLKRRDL